MGIFSTEGIIIKTTRAKENDLIVTILNPKNGKMNFFGRLAHKLQSSHSSALQIGNMVRFTLFEKQENVDIPIITETRILNQFPRTKSDFNKMLLVQYVIEVISKNTEEGHRNEPIYQLLERSLLFIEKTDVSLNWKTTFDYFVLQRLGMQPSINECVISGEPLNSGIFSVELGGMTDSKFKEKGYKVSQEEWLYLERLKTVVPYSEECKVPPKVERIMTHMLNFYGGGPFKSIDFYLKPLI